FLHDALPIYLAWLHRRPFALVTVPRSQDVADPLRVPGIDESLADFIAHRVQAGVRDPEFPEDPTGVFGVVELQRFRELELDGVALLRHRWRRNRAPIQQCLTLTEDEGISDRAPGDSDAVDARFVHHPANRR